MGRFVTDDYDGEYLVITQHFLIQYLNTKRMDFNFEDVNHQLLLETFMAVLQSLDFSKHTLVFSSC